jgi:putative transposase
LQPTSHEVWLRRQISNYLVGADNCFVLDVSSSSFYDWFDRLVSAHGCENAPLPKPIEHSHEASDGTCGSPRVVRGLIDARFASSESLVARLMKAAGIKAEHRRRRAPGQLDAPIHAIAPNLVGRPFKAIGLNPKWATVFTYAWTGEGRLFVAVVLDLCSRWVVGWSMQPTLTAQLVMDALLVALFRRGPLRAVLHHLTKARSTQARTSSACSNRTASFAV